MKRVYNIPIQLMLTLLTLTVLFNACGDPGDDDSQETTEPVTYPESAWEIDSLNARLGRGINMGNALDAPEEEGSWGVTLETSDFEVAAEAGFDAVRIPARWSDHVDAKKPYTIDAAFLDRVDWAIETALSLDLAVVLDVHHFESLMDDPDTYIPVLKAVWTQLSEHYKDQGPLLYFDILNEPTGSVTADQWNTLAEELVAIVRVHNPYRAIVIEPVNSSDGKSIRDLTLPDDDHLIASFHYYEPFEFTHQNASWVDGSEQWEGKTWPDTAADIERIRMTLDDIHTWQQAQGVPIYVGEFGAIDVADADSRAAWTATVVDEFTQRDWSFAYWMFHRVEGGNFGIYDSEAEEMDTAILEAMLDPQSVIEALDLENVGLVQLPEGASILLDDFEDTLSDRPEECHLAAAVAKALDLDEIGGHWEPFANLETEMKSPEGTHVVTYEEIIADGTEYNTDDAIGDWGYDGNGIGLVMDYQSHEYPYAGLTVHFLGEWNEHFFDFSDVTAISFMAKGTGVMRVDFASDAVFNGYPDGENWGFHGQEFVLADKWTQFVLLTEDFTAMPWSPSASDNLTWDDVKEKIFALQFSVSSTYGKGAHESLELYVDNIMLHGLSMDGFEPVAQID